MTTTERAALIGQAEDLTLRGLLPPADLALLRRTLDAPDSLKADDVSRLRTLLERVAPFGALKIPRPPQTEHAIKAAVTARRGPLYLHCNGIAILCRGNRMASRV